MSRRALGQRSQTESPGVTTRPSALGEWLAGPVWLFCPADRPDRYVKALQRADVVILDLEDAVAPDMKNSAREHIRALHQQGSLDLDRTVVRINGADTAEQAEDLELVTELEVARVMLAKAENAEDIADISCAVIPIAESPRGVQCVEDLVGPENVIGLMFGADDLVAGLGGTRSRCDDGTLRDVARYARARVLVAAKAHGLLALNSVHMNIPDQDGLRNACVDAAAVGFDATVAMHPSQVDVIRSAHRPSEEEVQWASRLLDFVGPTVGSRPSRAAWSTARSSSRQNACSGALGVATTERARDGSADARSDRRAARTARRGPPAVRQAMKAGRALRASMYGTNHGVNATMGAMSPTLQVEDSCRPTLVSPPTAAAINSHDRDSRRGRE